MFLDWFQHKLPFWLCWRLVGTLFVSPCSMHLGGYWQLLMTRFLVADTGLYTLLCWSVRPLVRLSVRNISQPLTLFDDVALSGSFWRCRTFWQPPILWRFLADEADEAVSGGHWFPTWITVWVFHCFSTSVSSKCKTGKSAGNKHSTTQPSAELVEDIFAQFLLLFFAHLLFYVLTKKCVELIFYSKETALLSKQGDWKEEWWESLPNCHQIFP